MSPAKLLSRHRVDEYTAQPMKPVAAFAAGLWTGALAMAAVGFVYVRVLDRLRADSAPQAQEQMESRIQLLQHDQAKAVAEVQRLRQTVAELRAAVEAPVAEPVARVPGVDPAVVEALLQGDAGAVARLEQAAGQGNLLAMDGLALLADRDQAAALTRVWGTPALAAAARVRATLLLAATAELNPNIDSLIETIAGHTNLIEAAVAGLGSPDFASRLVRVSGITPPPHFKPDAGLRLRLLDVLEAGATDGAAGEMIGRVRGRLSPPGVDTP